MGKDLSWISEKCQNYKINPKSAGEVVRVEVLGEVGGIDVDTDGARCVDALEVLADQGGVYSHLQHEHTDRLLREVHLDAEGETGIGNIAGQNRHSRSVSADDLGRQHVVALVPAVSCRVEEGLREVVGLHVYDDLAPDVALPAAHEADGSGNALRAVVPGRRRTSAADVPGLNLAGAAATVTVDVVAIITGQHKLLAIATHLRAQALSLFEVETEGAAAAGVAVHTTGTSTKAGQTSELLTVPVSANRAGDHWPSRNCRVSGVSGVSRVRGGNGGSDADFAVPGLASSTGDAGGAVKVVARGAGSETGAVEVDGEAGAIAAGSSDEGKSAPAEVVEVRS